MLTLERGIVSCAIYPEFRTENNEAVRVAMDMSSLIASITALESRMGQCRRPCCSAGRVVVRPSVLPIFMSTCRHQSKCKARRQLHSSVDRRGRLSPVLQRPQPHNARPGEPNCRQNAARAEAKASPFRNGRRTSPQHAARAIWSSSCQALPRSRWDLLRGACHARSRPSASSGTRLSSWPVVSS